MSLVSRTSVLTPTNQAVEESWPLMTTTRWKEPELSIGARCRSLDLLGRYKCWQIRDNSPAHLVWETVSKAIFELLEDQHEHLNARNFDFSFHMFMIGRKVANSSPTVLFSCDSKQPRRMAMEMVRKRGILTPFPGVLMAETSRVPKLLAIKNEDYARSHFSAVYLNGPIMRCGTSILVSNGISEASQKATMGGIVCIGDEYFGFTAGHPFLDARQETADSESEIDFAFYERDDSDDSGGSLSDEEYVVEVTGNIFLDSNSPPKIPNPKAHDESSSERHQELIITIPPTRSDTVPREILGARFAASKNNDDLDWALIKFLHPELSAAASQDSLFIEADSSQSLWATILVANSTSGLPADKLVWKDKIFYPDGVASAPKDTKVLLRTGSISHDSSKVLEGRLSGVPSFTKRAGSTRFQELWTIRLDNGAFYAGDCGSWIIDADNRNLYGHIISGYEGAETAYIVPASHTFQDIERTIGRPVELSMCGKRAWLQDGGSEVQASSAKIENLTEASRNQSPTTTSFVSPILGILELTASIESNVKSSTDLPNPSTSKTSVSDESAYSIFFDHASDQAFSLYKDCIYSDYDYLRKMSPDLGFLHIVLEKLRSLAELKPTRERNIGGEVWYEMIAQIKSVFKNLEVKLARSEHLDKLLQQNYNEIHKGDLEIRMQLIEFVRTLSSFVGGLIGSSKSRIDDRIAKNLRESQAQLRDGSIPDAQSTRALEEIQTWSQITEELEKMGINKTVIEDHESSIVELIRHCINEAKIRELAIYNEKSTLSLEISTLLFLMKTRLDQLVDDLDLSRKGISSIGRDEIDASSPPNLTRSGLASIGKLIAKLFRFGSGLIEAADGDDIIKVAELIGQGAKIDETDRWNWTALHMAAYGGHQEIVRLLVEKGADVKAHTVDNETPLELAISKGHVEVIDIILEKLEWKKVKTPDIFAIARNPEN